MFVPPAFIALYGECCNLAQHPSGEGLLDLPGALLVEGDSVIPQIRLGVVDENLACILKGDIPGPFPDSLLTPVGFGIVWTAPVQAPGIGSDRNLT